MNYKLKNIEELKKINIERWNPDIYSTYEWIKFLEKALKIDPILIEIIDNNKVVGYFIGGLFKKFGINIIGSPFRGWDTPYMGLLIDDGYSRINILQEIWELLKKNFKCKYMEVCDRNINNKDIENKDIKYIIEKTYTMDISKTEEELLNSFTKHCRKNIRLFIHRGASIKQVEYSTKFLDEFYLMLENVFKFQKLKPPYSKEKLSILFNSINKENILCLETYNPDGKCIGRSVSFGYIDKFYACASATDRNENYNQKNYLRWEAIKYWKKKGVKYYDLMGIRKYKLEFNPQEKEFYRIIFTKYQVLLNLRNMAKKLYWKYNKIKFLFSKRKGN